MRKFMMALVMCAVASTAMASADLLTMVDVTGGWHGAGSIIFQGVADGVGSRPVTIFICDFSTRVTPEGRWALNVPLGAIVQGDTPGFVTVRAVQDETNVIVERVFELKELNRRFEMNLKFQELWGE